MAIHRSTCPNIRRLSTQDQARVIEASWADYMDDSDRFKLDFVIQVIDTPEVLTQLLALIIEFSCQVTDIQSSSVDSELKRIKISIDSPASLNILRLKNSLLALSSVVSVQRIR